MFRHYKLGSKSIKKKLLKSCDWIMLGVLIGALLALVVPSGGSIAQTNPTPGIPITESTPWRSVPHLKNGSPEQNEKIAYAWKISGQDIKFIWMLNGENHSWSEYRIHDNSANTRGTDYGFGVNDYWHPEIVNDPRFFTDYKWQLDQVYRLWSTGTPFYGNYTGGIVIE